MPNVRVRARSIIRAAALWLIATAAACEPSPPLPQQTGTATTAADAQALARALAPRLGPPPGGYRVERTQNGQAIINTGARLGNVTVMGRAADGTVVTGCVSDATQVTALLGQGR